MIPRVARWLNRRGAAFHHRGEHQRAKACFVWALKLCPDLDEARYNLGLALYALGLLEAAESELRTYLSQHPVDAEVLNVLGLVLIGRGDRATALDCMSQACALAPDSVSIRTNLAYLLYEIQDWVKAKEHFLWLVTHCPGNSEAHMRLGQLQLELGRYEEGEKSLLAALQCAPESSEVRGCLATLHLEMGEYQDAKALFGAADFGMTGMAVRKALAMPMFPDQASEWPSARMRCLLSLDSLRAAGLRLKHPDIEVGMTNFKSAYHGLGNREFHMHIAGFYRAVCPALNWTARHIGAPPRGERLKIGIVSAYLLAEHSVGRIYGGLIEHLSTDQFDTTLFHVGNRIPGRLYVGEGKIRSFHLPRSLELVRAAIAAEQLDVLIYTDIGMDSLTYFLAFARLAPVQAVLAGHPDTTGIDSVDYYLSFRDIEPRDADSHYSEKLAPLDHSPIIYPAYRPGRRYVRADFGLPENCRIYGCLQTPFKFHPDFDLALAEILERDPAAHLLIAESPWPRQCRVLVERLKSKLPEQAKRLVILPQLDFEKYLGLLDCCDVLLDTWHFGGGNTIFHGFAAGVPTITWPGDYMRGRAAWWVYQQLGIEDFVATDRAHYAALAVNSACDKDRRQIFSATVREKAGGVFDHAGGIAQLEQFLLNSRLAK